MTYGRGTSVAENRFSFYVPVTNNRWAFSNVTFSFTNNFRNDYEDELGYPNSREHAASFESFNATQRSAARQWMQMYENVSGLTLTELTGANDRNATIRIAESNHPRTAYAYTPGSAVQDGDIWFNRSSYNNPILGNFAYYAIGQKIGHALGLQYNPFELDSSIMTYRLSASSDPVREVGGFAQSLMREDIRAIQQMYGANFNFNSTNTTYTFSTTTGEMFVNGVGQGVPVANRVYRTIWDGNGTDTYDFSNYSTNLSIDLAPGKSSNLDLNGNFQRARLGGSDFAQGHVFNAWQFNGDVRSLIENAIGGSGNDRIYGNSADNYLSGNDGDDWIVGEDGNDRILGNDGNDSIFGSYGDDWMEGNDGNDIVGASYGNDSVFGNDGNDSILGGDGLDYMDGGAGIDTLDINLPRDNYENYELNMTTGVTNRAGETVINFENVYTGRGNDQITGTSGDNYINTDDGKDYLFGLAGNDSLDSGAGNDFLIGGTGNDTMFGGLGDDSYDVDSNGDVVVELADQGTETVSAYLNYTLGDNLEILYLMGNATQGTGNSLNNQIFGNELANTLYGLDGRDYLFGLAGDDSLIGGLGDDALLGGLGNDTMSGGLGDDSYDVDSTGDVVVELTDQGTDTVSAYFNYTLGDNLEILYLMGSANSGTGNSLNNQIYGNELANTLYGLDGRDYLFGLAGDDSLIGGLGDDLLLGGIGNDTMSGSLGDDSYDIDSTGDVVVELADQGTDTVSAYFNYALGSNLEILYLMGSADSGTGNSLNNQIYGNELANTLSGLDGNDYLFGQAGDDIIVGDAGNDALRGGTGADSFRFTTLSNGIDSIQDFQVGEGDKIQINQVGFGLSSLDQFFYDSNTGALSFNNVQFASLQTFIDFNPTRDIVFV